jgi:16S rRNA (uracil1498-N3)-methyltransferase
MELYGKLSRLYRPEDLKAGAGIALDEKQSHYLKNVLRKNAGDTVRIFNGRDGEFLARIEHVSKKSLLLSLQEQIRPQPEKTRSVHMVFAPIKKNRMDFLIEKSVELGATDLHPVITARTENRHLNHERLSAQIAEAAEQCERMDIPLLHPALPLQQKIAGWNYTQTLHACLERSENPEISSIREKTPAFLTGPEGGFDEAETRLLLNSGNRGVVPISLGKTVYRAETAIFLCLAQALLQD